MEDEVGSWKLKAGSWELEAGSRKPEAGSRKPEAGSRKPEAGSRKPEAGSRKPEAGSRLFHVFDRDEDLARLDEPELAARDGFDRGGIVAQAPHLVAERRVLAFEPREIVGGG